MKYQFKSLLVFVMLVLVASFVFWQKNVSFAAATMQQRNWSLGGEARLTTNTILPYRSAVQLTSRCPLQDGRIEIAGCVLQKRLTTSGIVFTPSGPPAPKLRFADLYELSTDFSPRTPEMFSDCGGGSPRFEIGLDLNGDTVPEGNLFIYLGPLLEFRLCNGAWQNSGNLIGARDRRFDLQQFGGPFYGNYSETLSRVGHGVICYILLVVDSGWFPRISNAGNQNIHANNVRINEHWLLTNTALTQDNLSLEPIELVPFDGSLSDWQQAFVLESPEEGAPFKRIPLYRPDFKPAESETER